MVGFIQTVRTEEEVDILVDREGRKIDQGSIDFSRATLDEETGRMCVVKEEEIQSLVKEPLLECTHKNVEKCHYTYVTEFAPSQEEVCSETFQKICQITFKQQAQNETVKKCYNPLQSVCNGQGKDICRTVYESACSTRYIEKQPGKFVGDTKCEKQPIEICGAGCVVEEAPEECHDKLVVSVIDIPEEICDLTPQKTCRFMTKLVPKLTPKHECTTIPQEICNLRFTNPSLQKKPLLTKWCLDDSPVVPDETYEESNALGGVLSGGDFEDTTARGGDYEYALTEEGESEDLYLDLAYINDDEEESGLAVYDEVPAALEGDTGVAGTGNFVSAFITNDPTGPQNRPSQNAPLQQQDQEQAIPKYNGKRRRFRKRIYKKK